MSPLAGAPEPKRSRLLLIAGALVAVTAFAYGPSYRGGFLWDDDLYVSENPLLVQPDGLSRIWFSTEQPSQYFPMVYTTFRIERALWGLDTLGYRVVNVALHALFSVLVGLVLARLRLPGAWLAAAAFALHPVQAESVAWITERKNVLMGFFLGCAAYNWTRFAEAEESRQARLRYLSSLIFYLLALLSKTSACTFPAAQVVILWLRGERVTRRRWLAILPFVTSGLVMGLFTMWWERVHQGTRPEVLPLDAAERFLIASRSFWFYLGKVLWPVDLAFSYPKWVVDAGDPRIWVWPILCVAAAWALWRWRGSRSGQALIWAAAFFVGTLLPTSGLILLATFRYTYVADHYQYVACLGPIVLLCVAGARLTKAHGRLGRIAGITVAATVLSVLAMLTRSQSGIYRGPEILWRDTLEKNPGSWLAHNNLGTLLMDRGDFLEAERHFREAIEAAATFPESRNNLAVALARQGRTSEALTAAREAVAVVPLSAPARNTLGLLLSREGRLAESESAFREALRLDPRYARAHGGLGTTLFRMGREAEGIEHLQEAVRLAPDSAETRYNLASALAGAGRRLEALEQAREAVRLDPANPSFQRLAEALR